MASDLSEDAANALSKTATVMKSSFPRRVKQPYTVDKLVAERALEVYAIFGDREITITSVASPNDAAAGSLCFVQDVHDGHGLSNVPPGAVIICNATPPDLGGRCFIEVADPRHWFVKALTLLYPRDPAVIKETARVSRTARIGRGVAIGDYSYIGDGVVIGNGCTIGNCVTILEGSRLGRNCVVEDQTAIGVTAMAYHPLPEEGWYFLPHLGAVFIGNNVEIGANCVISRGILNDTVIGTGVKIGSMVNIAHNTVIGEHSWITMGATIGGRVELGRGVRVALGACVRDKIRIGEGAQIGMGAVVTRDVAPNEKIVGVPGRARPEMKDVP